MATDPLATHDFTAGNLDAVLEFLKRTRAELRALHRIRLWPDRLRVIDVNKDCFEVRGLGYGNPEVAAVLRHLNAAFDPQTIHEPIREEFKEFGAGRRHPWAEDRVM
jgi:hypothetical protein